VGRVASRNPLPHSHDTHSPSGGDPRNSDSAAVYETYALSPMVADCNLLTRRATDTVAALFIRQFLAVLFFDHPGRDPRGIPDNPATAHVQDARFVTTADDGRFASRQTWSTIKGAGWTKSRSPISAKTKRLGFIRNRGRSVAIISRLTVGLLFFVFFRFSDYPFTRFRSAAVRYTPRETYAGHETDVDKR